MDPSMHMEKREFDKNMEEVFKIGEREFVLRARHTPPEQEVQVTSSRPNEIEDESNQKHNQPSGSPTSNPSGTPHAASGPTVLETPVTHRKQLLQQEDGILPSQDSPSTPTKLSAAKNSRINGVEEGSEETSDDPFKEQQRSASEIPPTRRARPFEDTDESAFTSVSIKEHRQLVADAKASSQTTGSSNSESSGLNTPRQNSPAQQRNARKRLRGEEFDGKLVPHKKTTVVDLGSASDIAEESAQEPPQKRHRKTVSRLSKGTEESQNSIQSTIHVQLPHTAQSISPVAETSTTPEQADEHLRGSLQSPAPSDEVSSTPHSYIKSAEPPSSTRSTRSTGQLQPLPRASQNQVLRVYFSSSSTVKDSPAYTKFLRQHNVRQVKNIADAEVLCSGKGEIKRTSNLLLTVLKGREVVTDQWVIKSAAEKTVLDPKAFVPESKARAKEWGTSLADAIARGRRGLKPLEGWTINFTPEAKKELGKSWSELKDLCFAAGAHAVKAMVPKQGPKGAEPTVVIAASHEPDQSTLEEMGWRVFNKDIVTFSILRGEIDADSDEFLMHPTKTKKGGGRGRKKKS
ncbi:MAG: hypothetical protein LQ346_001530 [Caloplaca aetnensis]|nr:MAG: hypothetical protein LQ346_001530 [Caloplaca aetnensis]